MEVAAHAAAFMVALVRAGELEAAREFLEWYLDELGDAPELEAILEEADA